MASIAEGLLEAAQKYLGYQEQSNGYTKFGDWYYANVDQSDPYFKTAPWCDMFITWAATQAGVEKYVGEFAYTVDHAKWFKAQRAWSDTPEPGAIVFYDWSGSKNVEGIDHAGIVERADGERISTIEGNVDKLWLKRKQRDQSKVVGYGLPRKVQEKAGDNDREVFMLEGELDSPPEQPAAFGKAVPPKAAAAVIAPNPAEAMSLVDTMAVPAGALAALLGAVLIIKRSRMRPSAQSSSTGGRHRRTSDRHRSLAA